MDYNTVKKRLNNEIKKINTQHKKDFNYDNIISIEYNQIDITTVKYKFNDTILNVKLKYPVNYPFKPPCIYINNIFYNQILQTKKNQHLVSKLFHIKCLCCNTIICGFNWKPYHLLEDILLDMDNHLNIKLFLMNYHTIQQITNQYLLPELNRNIIDYLI